MAEYLNKMPKDSGGFVYTASRDNGNGEPVTDVQLTGSIVENGRLKITAPGTVPIKKPTGFVWNAPINVYRDFNGFYTDFDVSNYKVNNGGQTYYVSTSGSDYNDGLSESSPLRTVREAVNKTDSETIMVEGGFYDIPNQLGSGSLDKSVNIIAYNGQAVFSASYADLQWALMDGYTNVYQASRRTSSSATRVFDKASLDSYGDYEELTQVDSIAEVENTPGSFFEDSNGTYVHAPDSGTVTNDNIVVHVNKKNIWHYGTATLYLEGIDVEGGIYPVQIYNEAETNVPKLYMKNCTVKYGQAGNGLELNGIDEAFFQNVEVARNYDDGFNYHTAFNTTPKALEVDCIGRHNGTSSDTDNGSTMHDGGRVVRINGEYFGNKGPNIADVNNSQSWNVGTASYDSMGSGNRQPSNYWIDGTMWLYHCASYGSAYDFVVQYGNAYVHSFINGGNISVDSPARLRTF